MKKRGNSNTKERKALLEEFIEIFGVENIKALTADREFVGEEWFKWLKEQNIPFVIRIKNNTLIDEDYFGSKDIKNLFSHTQKDEFYAFGNTKLFGTELHLGGIKTTKSKEPLILVSNYKMDDETVTTYKKRWEIETMFGALKSKGFNFEESKLTEGYKIEKLMAFLAGDYREIEKPIPIKKKEPYRIKSVFKYGLEWLKNVLVNPLIKKNEFFTLIRLLENLFLGRNCFNAVE